MKGNLRISGGRKLISPKGEGTRPTTSIVREALINLLNTKLLGCNWLDLFSGSGAMGCEALMHGAIKVVAVEKNRKIAAICETNLRNVSSSISNKNEVKVIYGDVLSLLKKGPESLTPKQISSSELSRFDLVYLDPPYESNLYSFVLQNLLNKQWLTKNSLVICEHSSIFLPKVPADWEEIDRRNYGKTSLLFLSPLKRYLCDTGSMQPQTGPKS